METYEVNYPMSEELRTYMSKVLAAFEQYAKMSHHLAFEGLMSTLKLDDADRVADILSAHLMVATAEKQSLLELVNPYERLQRLHDLLDVEIEKINIDKRINVKVKKQMEKAQKEYYLNEKIKAIHQELGRKDDRGDELTELREKIEKAGLPKEVKEKAEQELKRLEAMPPVSAEATVSRNYIDWMVAVPWRKRARSARTSTTPSRCSTRTTTAWRRSRTASSSSWPCASSSARPRARSSASSALRASASRRSPSRSPAPPAASSSACRSAACATRPRSAATAGPTSAPSPARSSR